MNVKNGMRTAVLAAIASLAALPASASFVARSVVSGYRPAPLPFMFSLEHALASDSPLAAHVEPSLASSLGRLALLDFSNSDDQRILGAVYQNLPENFPARLQAALAAPADVEGADAVLGDLAWAQGAASAKLLPSLREESERVLAAVTKESLGVVDLWAAYRKLEKYSILGADAAAAVAGVKTAAYAARGGASLSTAKAIAADLLRAARQDAPAEKISAAPEQTEVVDAGPASHTPRSSGLTAASSPKKTLTGGDLRVLDSLPDDHALAPLKSDRVMAPYFAPFPQPLDRPSYEYRDLGAWPTFPAGVQITPAMVALAAYWKVSLVAGETRRVTFHQDRITVTALLPNISGEIRYSNFVDVVPSQFEPGRERRVTSDHPRFMERMARVGIVAIPTGETRADDMREYVIADKTALPYH
jgi:hypothetical protein